MDEGRVRNNSWWIDVLMLFFNRADAMALTGNLYKVGIQQALCISKPFTAFKTQYALLKLHIVQLYQT